MIYLFGMKLSRDSMSLENTAVLASHFLSLLEAASINRAASPALRPDCWELQRAQASPHWPLGPHLMGHLLPLICPTPKVSDRVGVQQGTRAASKDIAILAYNYFRGRI